MDDWIGVAGPLLGVVVGAGTTALLQRMQARHQRAENVSAVRREVYAQFLVAAWGARYVIGGLPDPVEWAVVGSTESASDMAKRLPALHAELRLVAGRTVSTAAETVVDLLVHDLAMAASNRAAGSQLANGDLMDDGIRATLAARQRIDTELGALRKAMQRELGIV